MSVTVSMARRRRRRLVAPLLLISAAALLVVGHTSRSTGDESPPPPTAQPWLGVLDQGGRLIDASPDEAKGEVWSVGSNRVLRYTDADGWTAMPAPLGADGQPITTLSPAGGTLEGRATRDGAVALLANDTLLVRDPGGARFHAAPPADELPEGTLPSTTVPPTTGAPGSTTAPASTTTPGSTSTPGSTTVPGSSSTPSGTQTPPLQDGETLYGNGTPLVVALSEDGHAGAFVVPAAATGHARDAVLHYDGSVWTREPICLGDAPACHAPAASFTVSAIDAVGADHAWLLATGTTPDAGIVLIHRVVEDGKPAWRPVSLGSSLFAQRRPDLGTGPSAQIVPRTGGGQPLVATSRGVWADASVTTAPGKIRDATLFYAEDAHAVQGAWCDIGAPLCDNALGAELPVDGSRSFAWADGSAFGTRLITGLEQGAMLRLTGNTFDRIPTAGRGAGLYNGAAFAAPDDGWLGGNGIIARYSRAPEADKLRQWPVPFRHPLTAITAEPGKAIGAIDAQALAVGDQGEVARYVPGQGWSPEALTGPTGKRATSRLRGVAWPAGDRAYVVGDGGEMWLWRKATGLWEPDPGKPATAAVAVANFTGIAFDPDAPDRGYAIGKQGVLLRYDREWTQEPLPAGLGDANFTSIAFAGRQAIVTYKTLDANGYRGGIIVNDGSGWREDKTIADQFPKPSGGEVPGLESTPERVAGLPDGSAIVATMGGYLAERDGAGAWHAADVDPAGFPAALAAFHDADGAVRAIVSIVVQSTSLNERPFPTQELSVDQDTILNPAPPGQAPVLVGPYPLPSAGFVLRQTAGGWSDEQHQAWADLSSGANAYDIPERPDAVLAFLTDPFGRAGWAVGGDSEVQTAGVMRYPDDGQSAPGAAPAPIATDTTKVTFAIGGGAGCLSGCADLEPVGAAPWRWLPAAVARAAQMGGVRAFLDTGPGTAGPGATDDFPHEQAAAAERLTASAGDLPVYTAASPSDRDAGGSLDTFLGAFRAASTPLGARAESGITPIDAARSGHAYYAFDSTGSTGNVRVVVLDTSAGVQDDQRCWLATQLSDAARQSTPAIVVGSQAAADLGDATAATMVTGAAPAGCTLPGSPGTASAYFYNAPQANRSGTIVSGGDAIPTFGTGSLGYIQPPQGQTDNPPNSGFLLAQVDVSGRDQTTNRAPVSVRLIPSIGELAVDATDGTLLRRSQIALFEGLARRPRAGQGCIGAPVCQIIPDPYTPIPDDCTGPDCQTTLAPEFRFSSSDPSVADFVKRDPASTNPRRPLLDAKGDPVADNGSGLLCAYNSGTTTITLAVGGLSYSQKVTVQDGSVRRPCGTVPANRAATPKAQTASANVADTLPQPNLGSTPTGGAGPLPPPPAPAAKAVVKPHHPPRAVLGPLIPFLPVASGLTQVVAAPPPPGPTAARPAPPSGTASSQVYQSAVAPERQREEEPAVDTVQSMARYDSSGTTRTLSRGGALLMLVLAGLALADVRPRPRPRYAFNTNNDDRRPPRTPK